MLLYGVRVRYPEYMTMSPEIRMCLVSGSWHGNWCWEPLQEVLTDKGIQSETFSFRPDDSFSTFDDYATDIAYELNADTNVSYVAIGHSRGANILPRVAGMVALQQQIFLCPSFETATLSPLLSPDHTLPVKREKAFSEAIIWEEDTGGLTQISPQDAREFLYQDCTTEQQDWAIRRLVATRRSRSEPVLRAWHDVPTAFIYGSHDRVVRPEWSDYVAREVIGVKPVVIDSDHSPLLSQTEKLAEMLLRLVSEV